MKARRGGHVKFRESVSEWEEFWISVYSGGGLGYRFIAALLYGIAPFKVTKSEMARIGRVARRMGCGCNGYRTGESERAQEIVTEMHYNRRTTGSPPSLARVVRAFAAEKRNRRSPAKAETKPRKTKSA